MTRQRVFTKTLTIHVTDHQWHVISFLAEHVAHKTLAEYVRDLIDDLERRYDYLVVAIPKEEPQP